jgi:hypothetical protein
MYLPDGQFSIDVELLTATGDNGDQMIGEEVLARTVYFGGTAPIITMLSSAIGYSEA